MMTLPELAADALGSFLASDMKDRFGSSHARLAELLPFAAQLALECIGSSDALYHNVEHTMLAPLAGHDILAPAGRRSDRSACDPHHLRKTNALYYEFEEIGLNKQLGYESPADLVANFTGTESLHTSRLRSVTSM